MPRALIIFLAVMSAMIGASPAMAQGRDFNCSIEWNGISGSQNRAVLQRFIAKCSGTPAATAARKQLERVPPPPDPEQWCTSRWDRIAYTTDLKVLRGFIRDCGRYRVGQTARNWLANFNRPIVPPPPPPPPVLTADQLFDKAQAAKDRQDFVAARRDWLAACQKQMGLACNNLGASYSNQAHGTANYGNALYYYDLACSLKLAKSCDNARIATSYPSYNLVDLSKASSYYESFLRINYSSNAKEGPNCLADFAKLCNDLGTYYFTNKNLPMASSRTFALYAWSCEGGYASACANAGSTAKDAGHISEVRYYYKKGCDKDIGISCYLLSNALRDPATGAILLDVAKDRMTRACTLGYKNACSSSSFSGSPNNFK